MLKAYITSKNPTKVNAVKEVLKDYEVIAISSNSMVSSQPKSDEETLRGAKNRCLNVKEKAIRIGLEGGVAMYDDEVFDGKMYLCNWGCLIDEDDNVYVASGAKIALPDEIKEDLLTSNDELAVVIERYISKINLKKDPNSFVRETNGTMGVLTNDYITRCDLFVHIVKQLYGQYLYNKKLK